MHASAFSGPPPSERPPGLPWQPLHALAWMPVHREPVLARPQLPRWTPPDAPARFATRVDVGRPPPASPTPNKARPGRPRKRTRRARDHRNDVGAPFPREPSPAPPIPNRRPPASAGTRVPAGTPSGADLCEQRVVLAFDVETLGPQHDVIAIGGAVVDARLRRLSEFLCCAYRGLEESRYEQACYDNFWTRHADVLQRIRAHSDAHNPSPARTSGRAALDFQRGAMIAAFVDWVSRWQELATENGFSLVLASDNPVADAGWINGLVGEHLPGTPPLPYAWHRQGVRYGTVMDVRSFALGVACANLRPEERASSPLMAGEDRRSANPFWTLRQRFALPECEAAKDHMPQNDARVVAHDLQCAWGVLEARYPPRRSNL